MRWSVLASLLLMGAIACGSADAPEPGQSPPTPSVSTTAIVSGEDLSSFSGRIAFDNFEDVWTIDAGGTNLTRLTRAPYPEFDPSWSPDGTEIAFRSERSGEPEIWIMNADGTGQRRLTEGLSPAWSPDGSLIAFSSRAGLAVIRPDGTRRRVLSKTEGGEYPSWSPDGSRIAFNSNLTGDHVMNIAQADGSMVVDLSHVGEGWQVDWSPDGRSILFTSHRDNPDNYTDVYVMRPDGSGIRRLTNDLGYTPAWSPDGEHIVFSAPGLVIMDPDGSEAQSVPRAGRGRDVDRRLDGRRVSTSERGSGIVSLSRQPIPARALIPAGLHSDAGGGPMPEPVVFISHFAVKEGALDELKRMSGAAVEGLREGKPRTVLFLSYLDDEGGRISFLHAFPDADAMDQHFEGADDRAAAAYEFIEPRGWEFYGRPSERAMEGMRATAAKFGVPLVVEPEFNAGFLRLAPA